MNYFKKHISNKSIFTIVILALLLSSCQLSENKEKQELSFVDYKHSEKTHLLGNQNYPAFNIDLRISLPTDSISYEALYRAMAITYFDTLYSIELNPFENLEQLSFSLIEDYKDLEKDFIADSTDFGASFNWEMISINEIVFKGQRIISFSNESFFYAGGAHGNTIKTHYVFDLESKKILGGNEFFKPKSCELIIDLQKKALEKKGVIIDEIYADGLTCEKNFYITQEGIYFHYDQYEIASYADGPIDIFISFDEIKPHLQISDLMNEQNE